MRLLAGCLVLLIAGNCNRAIAQPLSYEPAVVNLSGKLIVENHYGPPGFGETPLIDVKENLLILRLDTPVNVSGDKNESADSDSFSNVRRIGLLNSRELKLANLAGRHVTLRGTLSENQSGEYSTDVLMTVKKVIPNK